MSAKVAQGARRRRDGEGGFTLIEICISLIIMMIAGLGVASVFSFAVTYNQGAADRARAYAIAQQKVEIIRATPYADLTAALATAHTETVEDGTSGTDLRRFNVTMNITTNELVIAGTPRRKTITVTVTPQSLSGAHWSSGAVSLVTQRASNDMGPN
jgi:Tfp pilus assembly protein PilV